MSWTIEHHNRVAVVTMNTNPVNAQGRKFFTDFHEAIDTLEREHPRSPVVLTGTTNRFSAGLDLEEHFRLFAGDRDAVAGWFRDYRAVNLRLFSYPRPTVAAINGLAFAGGLITAAVCDQNVCVEGGARLGLPEISIGIPMPAVYARLLQYAWGTPVASRLTLGGQLLTPNELHVLGVVHELRPAEEVVARAIEVAEQTPEDAIEDYAFSKRGLQATVLREIDTLDDALDERYADELTTDASRRLHRSYWEELKGAAATW
jgi:enoyl-CoA hydratase